MSKIFTLFFILFFIPAVLSAQDDTQNTLALSDTVEHPKEMNDIQENIHDTDINEKKQLSKETLSQDAVDNIETADKTDTDQHKEAISQEQENHVLQEQETPSPDIIEAQLAEEAELRELGAGEEPEAE